jgi:hypothetical protein
MVKKMKYKKYNLFMVSMEYAVDDVYLIEWTIGLNKRTIVQKIVYF